VVLSSIVGVRKPAAEIFYAAAEQLRLRPADCAYIGDRISRDVIGAQNAGLGVMIQIRYPESERKDAALAERYKPDFKIDDLSEIVPIIERQNQREGIHA
jgi:putative hydrolase of the HAD superfamily